jgi:hypothetical protein
MIKQLEASKMIQKKEKRIAPFYSTRTGTSNLIYYCAIFHVFRIVIYQSENIEQNANPICRIE